MCSEGGRTQSHGNSHPSPVKLGGLVVSFFWGSVFEVFCFFFFWGGERLCVSFGFFFACFFFHIWFVLDLLFSPFHRFACFFPLPPFCWLVCCFCSLFCGVPFRHSNLSGSQTVTALSCDLFWVQELAQKA